jgi:hypothetical protein
VEASANLNLVYHNEDLLASISKFMDLCYGIKILKEQHIPDTKILRAVRENEHVIDQTRTLRQTYIELIATWLYIINNFIYFSEIPSRIIRDKFTYNIENLQQKYIRDSNQKEASV